MKIIEKIADATTAKIIINNNGKLEAYFTGEDDIFINKNISTLIPVNLPVLTLTEKTLFDKFKKLLEE